MLHIWESFNKEGVKRAKAAGFRGSDQAWLSYNLAGNVPIWPKDAGIYQAQDMKRDGYQRLPKDARIVHFNGNSKPWAMHHIDWIREHWR
jgi:hypothetical protein